MRTVSLMELRRHPGELVDAVRLAGESLLLERAGRPVAMLSPCPGSAKAGDAAHRELRRKRLHALARLAGSGAAHPRAADPDQWLTTERDAWR